MAKKQRSNINLEELSDSELFIIYNKPKQTTDKKIEVRNILMLRCITQVEIAAHRHYKWKNSCDVEDLIQEAWNGVIKSIDNYDASFNVPFKKYVFQWCDAYVRYAIYSKGRVIKTPVPVIRSIAKINKAIAKLKFELKRDPTIDEISHITNISPKKILKFKRADATIFSISTHEKDSEGKNNNNSFELSQSNILDPYSFCIKVETDDLRDKFINEILDEKERKIIIERHGLYDHDVKTLEVLAKELNMTRMGVLMAQRRAMRKVVQAFEKYEECGELYAN